MWREPMSGRTLQNLVALLPHPHPLPLGEGTAGHARRDTRRNALSPSRANARPLPAGEGGVREKCGGASANQRNPARLIEED